MTTTTANRQKRETRSERRPSSSSSSPSAAQQRAIYHITQEEEGSKCRHRRRRRRCRVPEETEREAEPIAMRAPPPGYHNNKLIISNLFGIIAAALLASVHLLQLAGAYKSTTGGGGGGERMVRLCIASVDPIKLPSQCVMCNRREFPLTVIDCTGITKVNDLIANPLSVQEANCLIHNCRKVSALWARRQSRRSHLGRPLHLDRSHHERVSLSLDEGSFDGRSSLGVSFMVASAGLFVCRLNWLKVHKKEWW